MKDHSTHDKNNAIETLDREQMQQQPFEVESDSHHISGPWRSILYHPVRALWRTTPPYSAQEFQTSSNDEQYHSKSLPPLATRTLLQHQYDILKQSQRTKKQLHRSHAHMLEHQKICRDKRRRERLLGGGSKTDRDGKNIPKDSLLAQKIQKEGEVGSFTEGLGYKPEQTCVHLNRRLLPNYHIMERIFREVKSLTPPDRIQIQKVLDFGIGCGGAAAAAIQVFGNENQNNNESGRTIEWIHGIDASTSMREVAGRILPNICDNKSVRITFGESLTSGITTTHTTASTPLHNRKPKDKKRNKKHNHIINNGVVKKTVSTAPGTFDMTLFCYTAQEIPSTSAILSTAAILWEKLAPNGIFVMVEPGTPDGFQSVRAVRQMLLDCCPSYNIQNNVASMDDTTTTMREEAHVIAPCTHNGICPMDYLSSKNKKDLQTKNTENIKKEDIQMDLGDNEDDIMWDAWIEDDNEDDEDVDTDVEEQSNLEKHTELRETDVFSQSFCSFVHALPSHDKRRSQWTQKKGEKISFIVMQKRVVGGEFSNSFETQFDDETINDSGEKQQQQNDSLKNLNVFDLLKESIHLSRRLNSSKHDDERANELHAQVMQLEESILNSKLVDMGLNLVKETQFSSENSSYTCKNLPWGRLVRAPLKRKGHVIVDYCTGCDNKKNEGKIVRHVVSKGKSALVAPGLYAAARKARWGGLWPDLFQSNEVDNGISELELNDDRDTTTDEIFLKELKSLISKKEGE